MFYNSFKLKKIRVNIIYSEKIIKEINNGTTKIEYCQPKENNEWIGGLNKYINF